MLPKHFVVNNFLNELEQKSLLAVENFETYTSSKGNIINYYQPKGIDSVYEKIKGILGPCSVRDYYVYNIEKPYRIHNDAGKNKKSFYTVIIPINMSGGLYILNQYSEETFLIDDYLSLKGQSNLLLTKESRQEKIVNYDTSLKLPDLAQLSHIKSFDKIGFSIDSYIEFNYNSAIFFESKYYHCSENTKEFDKQSLVIFLDRE